MTLRLPRLPRNVSLIAGGVPTVEFQRFWDQVCGLVEAHENYQDAILAAQTAADAANAAAAAASTAAASANTAATTAQTAADAVTDETNLVNSYVTGTPPILTATDAGSNATITVAAHTRTYGDGSTVSITGGSIVSQPYSTLIYVYYVDATRSSTTPTFLATTSASTAAQTGNTHLVGAVTTPAAAGPPETGDAVAPPGVGSLYT